MQIRLLLLLPLLWLNLQAHYHAIVVCLLLHAIAAATQDVAIDALCIRVTMPQERGRLNGWMQAGMLLGRAGLGGGALWLASWLGDAGVVVLLIGVIWLSLVALLPARVLFSNDQTQTAARGKLAELGRTALLAARGRGTWFGLAFALTGGAAFEGLGAVAGPLLYDQGFRSSDIGYLFALPMVACTIFGSLAGGRLSDRIGRRSAVVLSLVWVILIAC